MGVPWFSKSLHNLLALFSKNLRALIGTNHLVLFKKKLFGTIWHKLCRRLVSWLSLAQVSSHPLVFLSSSFSFSFSSCAKQFCHAYKSLQTHQAFNGFEINLVFEYENQQNLLKKEFFHHWGWLGSGFNCQWIPESIGGSSNPFWRAITSHCSAWPGSFKDTLHWTAPHIVLVLY